MDLLTMGANSTAAGAFDANTGAAGTTTPTATPFGTAEYVFAPRRDFKANGRGF